MEESIKLLEENIKLEEVQLEKSVKKGFKCLKCFKWLSSNRNLELHKYNMCEFETKCDKCSKVFISKKYLDRHKTICIKSLKCYKCDKILSRKQTYLKHISKCKKEKIIIIKL